MIGSYLARLGITLVRGALQPPAGVMDTTRLPLRVWPTDVDTYGHVNNGRFLTLMDMGRWDHWARTGLMRLALRHKWRPVVAAATIQFRRELKLLARSELVTRLAFWDERSLFIEQRFEEAGVQFATAFIRVVTRAGGQRLLPTEMLSAVGHRGEPSPPSPELVRCLGALMPPGGSRNGASAPTSAL